MTPNILFQMHTLTLLHYLTGRARHLTCLSAFELAYIEQTHPKKINIKVKWSLKYYLLFYCIILRNSTVHVHVDMKYM